MKHPTDTRFIFETIPLVLILCVLIACGINLNRFRGERIETNPEKSRVLIKDGGPHEGTWKTEHLLAFYKYTKNHDTMMLDCSIELDKRRFGTFGIVTHLFFRVNFFDIEGKMIQSKVVWNPGYSSEIRKWSFKSTLKLPSRAKDMGFSYEGSARESMGDEDSGVLSLDFWKSPRD
jgi:hypothetical protein